MGSKAHSIPGLEAEHCLHKIQSMVRRTLIRKRKKQLRNSQETTTTLNPVEAVGFVTGISAAMTPRGAAYTVIPFTKSSSKTPTVFVSISISFY